MQSSNIIRLPRRLPDVIFDQPQMVAEWCSARLPYMHEFDVLDEHLQAIGFSRNGLLVCGVVYNEYRGRDIQMHCASDDATVWSRYNISLVFDYPFNQLGVVHVTAPVPSTAKEALSINSRLGFVTEGVLRDFIDDGVDVVLQGMKKEECKWI